MAVRGSPSSLWNKQVPTADVIIVIELILASWESFQAPSDYEDIITDKFCAHLRNNKDRSIHWFRIECRSAEINDLGEEIGEIDLKFSQGPDEKVYLSFECKRLRFKFPSGFQTLAGKYVTEGMFRYFNGQYATDLDKGGMIGYVMDGNVSEAIQDVRQAVEKRRTVLYMSENETLRSSSALSSDQVRETSHNYGPDGRFTLYHLFLPLG